MLSKLMEAYDRQVFVCTQSYFSGHTLKHLGQCYVQYINRTYKRSATNGNFALGSERFQNEIEAALGRRARHGQSGRPVNNNDDNKDQLDLL